MPHGVCTSPARLARLEAERLARAPYVRTSKWWVRITPTLAKQMEAELDLYAVRPSKAEVITQLVIEGLAFRRMHRFAAEAAAGQTRAASARAEGAPGTLTFRANELLARGRACRSAFELGGAARELAARRSRT